METLTFERTELDSHWEEHEKIQQDYMDHDRLATYLEHIKPAIDWLDNQPIKKFIVKIENLSSLVAEKNLEKYLGNTFKKDPLQILKIFIERDA